MRSSQGESADYRAICDLAYHATRIPVRWFDAQEKMIFSCPQMKAEEDFLQRDVELVSRLYKQGKKIAYPFKYVTDLNECVAVVPVRKGRDLLGLYIGGPILTSEVTASSITEYAREKNLPSKYTLQLIQNYKNIPVMSNDRFDSLPKLIWYCVAHEQVDTSRMTLVSGGSELSRGLMEVTSLEAVFRDSGTSAFSRGAFQYQEQIRQMIRDGETKKLRDYIADADPRRVPALSGRDPLRQSRYLFIYYLSIAMDAAAGAGVDAEEVFATGEHYAQEVEKTKDLLAVDALRLQMLLEMAEKSRRAEAKSGPVAVQMCKEYIADHLYDRISVADLAEYTGISEHHLSSLFHKTQGVRIVPYIQNKKIEEAKCLLRQGGQSLIEVGHSLGFASQSYFATVFKRYAGCTPRQYLMSRNSKEKRQK